MQTAKKLQQQWVATVWVKRILPLLIITLCNQVTAKEVASEKNAATDEKPRFELVSLSRFNQPWAMAVLPTAPLADNSLPTRKGEQRFILVTQKSGELILFDKLTRKQHQVANVPKVAYGGQGGLGDVILAPDFNQSKLIYLSYVEEGNNNTRGAKVIRAKLSGAETLMKQSLSQSTPVKLHLKNIASIWQQTPKTAGYGHYSHRLLLSPDKQHLFISSGDRQKLTPAQDMKSNLGKIIRLHLDGSIPKDNPFADQGTPTNQFWSVGHRNGLGMHFDAKGRLWEVEMGPRNGDELNLIERGKNYGWPLVSQGQHYSGVDIPNHDTRPEFNAPKIAWTPVISPASLAIYQGNTFAWQGKALISGLSSHALVVVDLDTIKPMELYRYNLNTRLRNVTTAGNNVYLLQDGKNAHLWQLMPKNQH